MKEGSMMLISNNKLQQILERAMSGLSATKEDCIFMLQFPETSLEASLIRAAANDVMRKKSDNSAIILGQIGVDVSPCPGGCKFCTFGEGHSKPLEKRLSDDELQQKVREFCDKDDLYGLFLMTMHDYDLSVLLNAAAQAKKIAPATTQIWANVGDSDLSAFQAMKKAGITGVYHVCRIGEGTDTNLDPKDRMKTMEHIIDAGLELYTCCEPIGPEHSAKTLVENMFLGIELGCTQHAAMRRIAVPNTPLAIHGQISELRLALITAVVGLASFCVPTMTYLGVHEPNSLGYVSGANIITAESGANPRDTQDDTSKNRGMDMNDCRKMLLETGFSYIRRGDESKIPLTLEYINGSSVE